MVERSNLVTSIKLFSRANLALSIALLAIGGTADISFAQTRDGGGEVPVPPPPVAHDHHGRDGEGGGGGGGVRPLPLFSAPVTFPTVTTITPPPPVPTRPGFGPATPVQTDVQPTLSQFPGGAPAGPNVFSEKALGGVILLKTMEFPQDDALEGPISGITVKWVEGSQFSRPNEYIVKFDDGEILVSVKNPSHTAIIKTPMGKVAITANGDVLARYRNGVLRVTNLDGLGKTIKAQIDRKGIFDRPVTVALAAGSELTASAKRLTRADLRPKDGLARRGFKVIENSHLAISEISVDSILRYNDLMVSLRQAATGAKERRIVGDMSKMAAILNIRNGVQGFTIEDPSQVASKPTGGSTQ